MINFLIWAPEYTNSSGGIIALHKLADLIAKQGENSFIFSGSTFEGSSANLIVDSNQLSYFIPEKTMVLYPEIISGNPFNSKFVTRWLLNTPGKIGGDGIYDENDLVYKYLDYFIAPDESKVKGELRTFDLKLDKFINRGEPRSGECYLIKKGFGKVLDKHKEDSLNIDHYINDDYLVDVFNQKEYFISYDAICFHLQQAVLCGCIPVVIPDEGVSREEYLEKSLANKYGIAYGFDDIERAKETAPLLKGYLESLEEESVRLVKSYIADCYSHMGLIKNSNRLSFEN
jgi:hypothetical protein